MIFPQTHFLAELAARLRRVLQTSEQIVQPYSCADRFTFRFPQPFLRGTELTENPMTKCEVYKQKV